MLTDLFSLWLAPTIFLGLRGHARTKHRAEVLLSALAEVIQQPFETLQGLSQRLDLLRWELERDLDALQREAQRDGTAARLAGVLGVLGGSLVVAV